MSNRNTLWANVFVDELARAGLQAVCIAPGSRSTPLTIAFAEHDAIAVYSHLDERSAAFFALGYALATETPVALVCTSGTAAANFYPAIVEAHMSRVPLLVLTADRPPELRHSGANQTIDQIKMYGDYALWSVDAALPEAEPSTLAIRNLRTLAGRALATATGIRKGVVHINLPFRKPLEPIAVAGDSTIAPPGAEARDYNQPYSWFLTPPTTGVHQDQIEWLNSVIQQHERGLIVSGLQTNPLGSAVAKFARVTGYPVLAEAFSNLRFNPEQHDSIIGGYDTFLESDTAFPEPEVIIQLGGVPTSKALNSYLARIKPEYRIYISPHGEWADDSHSLTHYLQAGEAELLERTEKITFDWERGQSDWLTRWQRAEAITWETIDAHIGGTLFDGTVAYDVINQLPDGAALFVGNSLPVRLFDQFGKPTHKSIQIFANRGASGIDGNISTALGIGAAEVGQPIVGVVGDVTFYHDMNGLLAVQRCGVPMTIVLLNNDGGGIFHRLPVRNFDPPFTDLFVTPHGLNFEHAARLYGLDHVRIDARPNADRQQARETFQHVFNESLDMNADGKSRIIEVMTDVHHDLEQRRTIIDAVRDQFLSL